MNQREATRIRALIPDGVPRYIRVYDNDGKTADRYTVVFTGRYTHKTGGATWYLGMNAAPFHPLGIGMSGEADRAIDRPGYSHLGKKTTFNDLPQDCKKAVLQTYTYLWDIPMPQHSTSN